MFVLLWKMLHGMHTRTAVIQLKAEGWRYLYRGILPPLCQKTISVSIMFGMYSHYQEVLTNVFPHWKEQTNKSTAAMLAGLTEAVLTPFERVQMLLQDRHYHQRFKNTAHAFVELRQYGIKEYFRGSTPILLRNSLSNVLFFSLRDEIALRMPSSKHWSGKILSDFCCGAMASSFAITISYSCYLTYLFSSQVGAFISTVFYPINIVKTHMQCRIGGPFYSLSKTFELVYIERDRSIRKLFYGVHVNYTRALISWVFHKLLYNQSLY